MIRMPELPPEAIVAVAVVFAVGAALLAGPWFKFWFALKARRERERTVRSEMGGLDAELEEVLSGG